MSSPQPAQNRALLCLPVAPTTRPLSRHIMSPLYCLLLSGDDNFKAQILFAGAGGRMEAVWGRARASRLSFSLCFGGGLLYVWGLPLNTHHPPGAAEQSQPLRGPPTPESCGPAQLQALPHLDVSLGAETSSKEPALVTSFGHCPCLLS